jgi:hypothetical protein
MEKNLIVSILIVMFVMSLAAISTFHRNNNQTVGLAIADSTKVTIQVNNKIEIRYNDEKYSLAVSSIRLDRKGANFILTSDTSTGAPYVRDYFKLYPQGKTSSMYNRPEQFYVYPGKSETVIIGEKQLYIELVSIQNRAVTLLIKWIE